MALCKDWFLMWKLGSPKAYIRYWPVHHHLHEEVPDPVAEQLDTPGHDPVHPSQDEDAVPHPKDGEDLVKKVL